MKNLYDIYKEVKKFDLIYNEHDIGIVVDTEEKEKGYFKVLWLPSCDRDCVWTEDFCVAMTGDVYTLSPL